MSPTHYLLILSPTHLSGVQAMTTTPRESFDQMRQHWLGHPAALTGDDLADDVTIETPFAPPGRPTRIDGKQQFLDFANAERAAIPVRFDECRTIAIHETTDPETIIVEYELTGTSTKTNEQHTATFIGVLTVHDGKITLWREYQNTLAIMRALG
ncbi:nuclear transport factor 2 family protein [Saccharopolyspora sp. K220]|uniref:nuclear transport factor 2 family protein n=1 Tax=Saccharopolyspora soli TaxID=2926618 RepID=UPI001F55E9CD|nr:nuclear transport factor 2 family protein [Saccharopolyspora soli]MCI2422998.1 nuclear transport factor 2 family protein [Saccharopolyspora soli]